MTVIDLNADMGESFGPYRMGDDDALLDVITSANVACGFHGGDPLVMHATLAKAKARGVSVGAHPGFDDLRGFGRRRISGHGPGEVEKLLIYQIGALQGMAQAVGVTLTHYKVHGALANMACEDQSLAMEAARAVKAVAPELLFVVMPRSAMETAGNALGLRMAREIYADRAYDAAGRLAPRSQPGAVLHDPKAIATRVMRALESGGVESVDGAHIPMPVDTICLHGDTPDCVAIARAVRAALDTAGITVAPMAQTLA